MGENQGAEEDKTPRGKKRKRGDGDSEVIKTIATFVEEKFKNELKEAVLKEEVNLNDPIIQIGIKLFVTDLFEVKGALATSGRSLKQQKALLRATKC